MRKSILFILILTFSVFNAYSQLIWSTYLGGNDWDCETGIKIDSACNSFNSGWTGSVNFPTTEGAYLNNFNSNIKFTNFITKLNPNGSGLIFSTFIGPVYDYSSCLAIDRFGNSYINPTAGKGYPLTQIISDTSHNDPWVVVTKLNPLGTGLIYSTFIGYGLSSAIVIDTATNVFISGISSKSYHFPSTPGAYDTTQFDSSSHPFNPKIFITKLDSSGTSLIYSTFLASAYSCLISVNDSGCIFLSCQANRFFPTTPNSYDISFNFNIIDSTGFDFGVAKFNSNGSDLIFSTFIGGTSNEGGATIKSDKYGNPYISGPTQSHNYPVTPGAYDMSYNGGYWDGVITKLNYTGNALIFSTFLGGDHAEGGGDIAIDKYCNTYILGTTNSLNFPTTPNALSKIFKSNSIWDYNPTLSILDPTGSFLIFSTYLDNITSKYINNEPVPGSYNMDIDWIRTDIYISICSVAGNTPVTPNAYDTSYNGKGDINVAKYAACFGTALIQTVKSLSFRPYSCDSMVLDTFYIHNPGTCFLKINNLTITGPDSSQFSIFSSLSYYSFVEFNDSLPIIIGFKPNSKNGTRKATLKIYNSSFDSIVTISLTGHNSSYTINNSESDTIFIDLGKVCIGSGKDTTITIINKSSKGSTFIIENNDPKLQILTTGKAEKGNVDKPQAVLKKKAKKNEK